MIHLMNQRRTATDFFAAQLHICPIDYNTNTIKMCFVPAKMYVNACDNLSTKVVDHVPSLALGWKIHKVAPLKNHGLTARAAGVHP